MSVKSDSSVELWDVKCDGVWRITFQRYGSIIFFYHCYCEMEPKERSGLSLRLQQTAKAKMEVLGVVSPENGIM